MLKPRASTAPASRCASARCSAATRAAELAPGDALAIELAAGQVDARVERLR